MDPDIRSHLEKADEALSEYIACAKSVQAICQHRLVLHSKTTCPYGFSTFGPMRLCLECGLEEHGRPYYDDARHFKHLRSEFVKEVSMDELYQARFDHLGPDNIRRVE